MSTFNYRWTVHADVTAEVEIDLADYDGDEFAAEEAARDLAFDLAQARLGDCAVTLNGAAIHADIDGIEPEQVED
ncbi:hypothetical protein [Nocardioides sp. GY 10127]|uniref:hypothetical protein n=1 Tax=Nocardioides sp. GY 10127 TaxID=2569762 RepID=UPI0010A7BE97|nr:hypothetical protein [Nocardioides sp. GY 10127]TIC78795.1 hypothetical protein E8D37_19050 [Nocardioides sp. GY 10127]